MTEHVHCISGHPKMRPEAATSLLNHTFFVALELSKHNLRHDQPNIARPDQVLKGAYDGFLPVVFGKIQPDAGVNCQL